MVLTCHFPLLCQDEIVPPKPYTDEEALEIVSELEDALRLRLSCLEILPIQMSNYTISNGRANFLVKGLFEASVTLSGSDDQDRFFLLSLKFDFRITGLGKERFKRAPEKSSRLQILEDGNFFLIPRSPAADRSEEIEKEGNEVEAGKIGEVAGEVRYADKMDLDFDLGGGIQDGDETMLRKDGPLLRLYSFLRECFSPRSVSSDVQSILKTPSYVSDLSIRRGHVLEVPINDLGIPSQAAGQSPLGKQSKSLNGSKPSHSGHQVLDSKSYSFSQTSSFKRSSCQSLFP